MTAQIEQFEKHYEHKTHKNTQVSQKGIEVVNCI